MKFFYLITISILLFSCKKCREKYDDPLCSSRIQNTTYNLRLDGYYYFEYDNGAARSIYFHYTNGVILAHGVIDSSHFESFSNFTINYRDQKFNWGIYNISDSSLTIERWYPGDNLFKVYKSDGKILNDTTYLIINSYRCDGSEWAVENEIYHFKKFSPKPDSTNSFTN